jgi:hypothetical protein
VAILGPASTGSKQSSQLPLRTGALFGLSVWILHLKQPRLPSTEGVRGSKSDIA